MKKLLLLLLWLPLFVSAQIPAANDTTLYSGSTAFTPQFRFKNVTLSGVSYRIPQVYNSLLGKYDTYITSKYLRAFYAPMANLVGLNNRLTLWTGSNTVGYDDFFRYGVGAGSKYISIGGVGIGNNPPGDTEHILNLVNNGSTQQLMKVATYGSGVFENNVHWNRAGGTETTPTQTLNNMFYMSMGTRGFGSGAWMSSNGAFQAYAIEDQTTSNRGMKWRFEATPLGSNVRAGVLDIFGDYLQTYKPIFVGDASNRGYVYIQGNSNSGYNNTSTIVLADDAVGGHNYNMYNSAPLGIGKNLSIGDNTSLNYTDNVFISWDTTRTARLYKQAKYTGNFHAAFDSRTLTDVSYVDSLYYPKTGGAIGGAVTAPSLTLTSGGTGLRVNASGGSTSNKDVFIGADATNIYYTNYANNKGLIINTTTGESSIVGASLLTSLSSTSTAVTQSANDNSTKVATTAYVDRAVATETKLRTTGSGNGVLTTITIPHGVTISNPATTKVFAQAMNAAAGSILYATVDATNVYMWYAVAPANGTNNLDYSISITP